MQVMVSVPGSVPSHHSPEVTLDQRRPAGPPPCVPLRGAAVTCQSLQVTLHPQDRLGVMLGAGRALDRSLRPLNA